MRNFLKNCMKRFYVKQNEPIPEVKRTGFFSTDVGYLPNYQHALQQALDNAFREPLPGVELGAAMDSGSPLKQQFNANLTVPPTISLWYASQTFIGYQFAALMAQHWLVSKACMMPAKDAVRNGYELTVNDGTKVPTDVLDAIRKADVAYNINRNLIEMVQLGRVFGIRVVMFIVENDDPDYYTKPFNIDGVTPGSYKGISQLDPYWITPQLDSESAGNPASINFYEPTWWRIRGTLVHRTHLIIYRTEEVSDILKPQYIYGGIPIPQKIYERVYAAERTANEAPMLALTKRVDVVFTDNAEAVANQADFMQRMAEWVFRRDNYGIKTLDKESEDMKQFDTSLADLDAVIMTQYQLVAAAANVPATKLLGTQPKGFNASGDYEEAAYHEELESIQTHDLTPLLERHHMLLIYSEIAPKFNIKPFEMTVTWDPLDALTNKEQAEINEIKARTGQTLMTTGAIDGQDERLRIINDPDSGYNGLVGEEVPEETIQSDPEADPIEQEYIEEKPLNENKQQIMV